MRNRIISCGGFRKGQRPTKVPFQEEDSIEYIDPEKYDRNIDDITETDPEVEKLQIAEYIEPVINRTEGLSGDFRHTLFDSEFEAGLGTRTGYETAD